MGAAATRAASARLILRSRDGRLLPPTWQKCPPLSARRPGDRLPESARSAGTGGSRAGGPPTWFHGPRHRLCERGCARGAGRAGVEAGGGSRGHEQRRPAGGAHGARVPSGMAPRSRPPSHVAIFPPTLITRPHPVRPASLPYAEQRRPAPRSLGVSVWRPGLWAPRSMGAIPTHRGAIKARGSGAGAETDGGVPIKLTWVN